MAIKVPTEDNLTDDGHGDHICTTRDGRILCPCKPLVICWVFDEEEDRENGQDADGKSPGVTPEESQNGVRRGYDQARRRPVAMTLMRMAVSVRSGMTSNSLLGKRRPIRLWDGELVAKAMIRIMAAAWMTLTMPIR